MMMIMVCQDILAEIVNMADGMDFGLNQPCRDYFTCVGGVYKETSCPDGESIIAGSTTEYQGLILTLVKCQSDPDLDCDYRCADTTDRLGTNGPPTCTAGGLKELEKLETSIENPVAYPSCASIYNDCVPESTCADGPTDYFCTCGPGLTGDGRYKGSGCTDLDECNMWDPIAMKIIEQCPDPDKECYNFDYTKTSINSILTKDYGIMYRCNDVKCNSWPTDIGDKMWEISGECNKYEVCKDGIVQEMRCFSDIVNGVWVYVDADQKCMPEKDVPCSHACENCPKDVDECATGAHDCVIGQTCINHIGVAPGRIADRASFQCASKYCNDNNYLKGKSKLVEVKNSWDTDYDCNSYGYCLDGVYLKGVCAPGLRFDNTAERCVDISSFNCNHHCSTEACDFKTKTITQKKAGGGQLIPGLHQG